MEKIGIILAFYTLLGSIWWLIAKMTGPILLQIIFRLFGISGAVFSFLYILLYFKFI